MTILSAVQATFIEIILLSSFIIENKAESIVVRSKDKYVDEVTYLLFEIVLENTFSVCSVHLAKL